MGCISFKSKKMQLICKEEKELLMGALKYSHSKRMGVNKAENIAYGWFNRLEESSRLGCMNLDSRSTQESETETEKNDDSCLANFLPSFKPTRRLVSFKKSNMFLDNSKFDNESSRF